MTQPWSNQGISLLVIQTGTGFSGLFVYSGAPALNTLVASIAATGGTDPYGNPYPAGIMDQRAGGSHRSVLVDASLTMQKLSGVLAPPLISLSDATAAVTDGTTIHSGSIVTPVVFAVVPGDTSGTAESWHSLTPAAGWANNGGSEPGLGYRMTALGDVELLGHVNGTIAGNTTIGTLPANYFSGSVSYTVPLLVSASAGFNAGQTPRISMTAGSGALVVKGVANGATTVELDGITIPLSNG